jgi:hypothetical protein
MSSKRIEIFQKASTSLKISLKCHAYLKKSLAFSKKDPRRIASLPLYLLKLQKKLIEIKIITGFLSFYALIRNLN